MLISIIVGAAVAGMTYTVERAIDRTIQQGRSIKQAGGSIRQTVENMTAGMVTAAIQPPVVPQPAPVRYDADEFDDDDFFCDDCDDIVAEETTPVDDEPELITADVIEEEPEQNQESSGKPPRNAAGQFTKKGKK